MGLNQLRKEVVEYQFSGQVAVKLLSHFFYCGDAPQGVGACAEHGLFGERLLVVLKV